MSFIAKKTSPTVANVLKQPNLIKVLKPGDLVESILLEKNPRAAYFDLGAWGTGVVYGAELKNSQDILKNLKAGEKVSSKIVELDNEQGFVELSLAGAEKQKTWQVVKDYMERGEIISVKVIGANAGGLLVKVSDVNGFVPISQLMADHAPKIEDGDRAKILSALQGFLGQELKVKVIDVNPRSNKLILSERETVEENVKELLSKYKVGDTVDGIVSGVADFGAFFRFTDNPKIEGLIHISELDHRLVQNPKDIVKLNDSVKAKIIEIKDGRVSLSLKALKEDPWLKAEEFYKAGQEVNGTVAHFHPFGAFINLDHSLQGLVHVSEFGSVDDMKKKLEVGQSASFVVEGVKPAEKRIILKIKK